MPPQALLLPGLALLFDLDGVLIHSTPVHNLAWELYLKSQQIAVDGIEARMLGKHNDEIVADFFGSELAPAEIKRHGSEKERLYRELLRDSSSARLVHGVAEFLSLCTAVPKAVASNAEPANVAFVLEQTGLAPHFHVAVDGSQVERPKPAPDIYIHAARLLGVRPRNCIVFEDSHVGVTAARDSGARVVGVRTSVSSFDGVDLTIDDFTAPELPAWLRTLVPRR